MRYKSDIIAEKLRKILLRPTWKVNDLFYSENQLAMKFDVSRQTIRDAINTLTDEGYLYAVKGSGTYISDKIVKLRKNRSYNIGVLVTYLSDYIFPVLLNELENVFTENGFSLILSSTSNSSKQEKDLLTKLLNRNIDGLILEPTKSSLPNPNIETYNDLLNEKFPIVSIHAQYPNIDFPLVALDDTKAGYIATDYLIKCNHKKIGAVMKSDDRQGLLRYKGVIKAHNDYGLVFDDKHMYWYTTEDKIMLEKREEEILERFKDCTAIVCFNDNIGIIVERVLLNNNISVPEDISIISIDNSRYASLAPVPLTSVNSPIKEIANSAANNLIKQIYGMKFERNIIFEPHLVIRDSVKKLRKN